MQREEAIHELEKHGIKGTDIYLIDIIPLIEMIWADEKAQESEIEILFSYMKKHIKRINSVAGFEMLSEKQAKTFIQQFIDKRPDQKLLETIRSFVAPVLLSSTDDKLKEKLKTSILKTCMDIAASSVTEYPYDFRDRFNSEEKRTFFEILEALTSS